MSINNRIIRFILFITILALIGCTSIGTRLLPKNRQGFNGAMINSDEQQLLLNLVRIQFEDRPFFLSVESITTSNTFSFGGLPSSSFNKGANSQNLSTDILGRVSSSVGNALNFSQSYGYSPNASLSDSPTISFSPLQGEKFTKQILSKLSMSTLFLLLNSGWNIDRVMRSLVEQIDDYENVAVLSSRAIPNYKKFIDLVEYIEELYEEKIIYYNFSEITTITLEPGQEGYES